MINKLIDFIGVENEGWRRLAIASFIIPIIFGLWILRDELYSIDINDIMVFIILVIVAEIGWVIVLKVIVWIAGGFRKN